MRVDGREVPVHGRLLQPLRRRTSDQLRVVLSGLAVVAVVVVSYLTRGRWESLENSISDLIGGASPELSNRVYSLYGVAILALPFAILVGIVFGRRWKLFAGYAAAALLAGVALSITGDGIAAPQWHLDLSEHRDTFLSQFLDDSRWIAMLAAVLTVCGPWLPRRWRRLWWVLLLAFVPIHLFVSATVPARAMLGLTAGWFVGALVVLFVGTPALEVPVDLALRVLGRRGRGVQELTVLSPAGPGPLVLAARCRLEPGAGVGDGPFPPAEHPADTESSGGEAPAVTETTLILDLFGQHQRTEGVVRQAGRWLTLRSSETLPPFASLRRAVEHRALMATAFGALDLAANVPIAVAVLDRGWMMYAHTTSRGVPLDRYDLGHLAAAWEGLNRLHAHQMSHGDLRPENIRIDDDAALFDGFARTEVGASDSLLLADVAQLLLVTADLYGVERAVSAAVDTVGADRVIAASGRLTRTATPNRIRRVVRDPGALMAATRAEVRARTDTEVIRNEQVTRFSRNQLIQLALLIGLVYVAYPFVSQVPTFLTEMGSVIWWWVLLGLAVSGLTYVGAAAALWACASESVNFRHLTVMQFANTFAATTTPAGVGGLALSVRFLQHNGLGGVRATAAVALQQTVQVVTHIGLLIVFSVAAGKSADLSHFIPSATIVYLIAGVLLGVVGAFMVVPKLRRWLSEDLRPQIADLTAELVDLARDPGRFLIIVGGCAATTLGAALALWASVEAFGGSVAFVTVTIVTMIGGTLASAAPTPGGVGAVEAALIGGLAAFGVPASIAVPAVLLYRVLTCWLPVVIGWPTLRWLQRNDLV
ncbi:lysylphosphatidylglycerol synthase domain-containing protein [Rhodococcus sp. NPDC058505]|uniref:lysylphosphatidylglycerol synthase domain-containing protein n=1 Tax=unclassified Rhodococcus (in: high G+C Gram-positive bacteria) TaxID=192944 RepID=UPI003665B158